MNSAGLPQKMHKNASSRFERKIREMLPPNSANTRAIRPWSDHETDARPFEEVKYLTLETHFVWKTQHVALQLSPQRFTKCCACHEVTLQHHQILCLPRKVNVQHQQRFQKHAPTSPNSILLLPQKVTLQQRFQKARILRDFLKNHNRISATHSTLSYSYPQLLYPQLLHSQLLYSQLLLLSATLTPSLFYQLLYSQLLSSQILLLSATLLCGWAKVRISEVSLP